MNKEKHGQAVGVATTLTGAGLMAAGKLAGAKKFQEYAGEGIKKHAKTLKVAGPILTAGGIGLTGVSTYKLKRKKKDDSSEKK